MLTQNRYNISIYFAPLFSAIIQPSPESKLASLYAACVNNGFSNHSLALLLDQLAEQNYHFVLLVDELRRLGYRLFGNPTQPRTIMIANVICLSCLLGCKKPQPNLRDLFVINL